MLVFPTQTSPKINNLKQYSLNSAIYATPAVVIRACLDHISRRRRGWRVNSTRLALRLSGNTYELCAYDQGGVTPQSSVLLPVTAVKHKVKGQEAKIVKVEGQA